MISLFRSLSLEHLRAALARFPLALLSSALCAFLLMWMADPGFGLIDRPEWLEHLTLSLFIGILLFGGLSLLAEALRLRSWLIQLVGIPLLYFLVYLPIGSVPRNEISIVMVFFASLALIFVGAYVRKGKEEQGFWSFCLETWIRAMVAIIASSLLSGGFSLALISIETLFSVDMGYYWQSYLMIFFLVFIASLIFYTGIPSDYKSLQKEFRFEKAVRAFALYLSFPLLTTYFFILSAYVVKILITQNWPDGFVALPVLLFTLLGFGTYALIFPLREGKASRVITWFSKIFPWAAMPFLIVYFISLWKRIEPYGITELRYLAVLIGMVLMGWCLYYALIKKASLRWIPLSFVIVGFLFSFGPWGLKSVSEWSQKARLEELLMDNGLLVDGMLVKKTVELPEEIDEEISSKVEYLFIYHGTEPFEAWFGKDLSDMDMNGIFEEIGLAQGSDPYHGESYYFWSQPDFEFSNVSGYDLALRYEAYEWQTTEFQNFQIPNESTDIENLRLRLDTSVPALVVDWEGIEYSLALADFIAQLESNESNESLRGREELSLSFDQEAFKMKIFFNSIAWSKDKDEVTSLDVDTDLYLSIK